MRVIQFGKKESKVDLRSTLFITDTNFIVVRDHLASLPVDAKESFNCLIKNLISLENNGKFLTITYATIDQKSKTFCISDLTAVDLGQDKKEVMISSLDDLYKYLGETFFTANSSRKETLSEKLLSSLLNIFLTVLAFIVTYVIWINPSLMNEEHSGTALSSAKKNLVFGLLGKLVDLLGSNIAGGLFLALATFGVYSILKRLSNKKEIALYTK
jgi:hypothetical protein